jgi:CheY-like chemotaxis protein
MVVGADIDRLVLVVDDDPLVLKLLSMIITSMPSVNFISAQTSEEALQLAMRHPIQMVITDMNMPGKTGAWLLQQLRTNGIDVPVVMHSGSLDPQDEPAIIRMGATKVLRKPAPATEIMRTISEILDRAVPPTGSAATK